MNVDPHASEPHNGAGWGEPGIRGLNHNGFEVRRRRFRNSVPVSGNPNRCRIHKGGCLAGFRFRRLLRGLGRFCLFRHVRDSLFGRGLQSLFPRLQGGFRTESFADLRTRVHPWTADQIDAVGNRGKNAGNDHLPVFIPKAPEGLRDGLRLTGQIDDEGRVIRYFTKRADLARKNRGRDEFKRDRPHLLAEPGELAGRHGERGFRRHVAARGARAAGRENEVAFFIVDQFCQRLFDRVAVIRNQAFREADRGFDRGGAPFAQSRNALILINAAARPVRNRNETDQNAFFVPVTHASSSPAVSPVFSGLLWNSGSSASRSTRKSSRWNFGFRFAGSSFAASRRAMRIV